MGSGFSSSVNTTTSRRPPTAMVISIDGSLVEYSQPVKVSHVVGLNHHTFFLCNADELFYGHHIQALDDNHFIELGKLYFFLPGKRLKYPLTAVEMAALAARANSAFADDTLMRKKKSNHSRRMRKRIQVLPAITAMESEECERFNEHSVGSWKTERFGRKRGEVKQRALRRGEGAVNRQFRPRLGSIEEVYE